MKQFMKFSAFLILLVSILIATIGKLKPELFMAIPYGFILWAMTGNQMPPYFGVGPWQGDEYRNWLRDGDLIVTPAGKSGTTWMLYCTHNIRVKGADWDFNDPTYTTPWPEFVQKPGQTWEQRKTLMNTTVIEGKPLKEYWDHPSYPFRIFKSHYTPRNPAVDDRFAVLPVREDRKIKYLAMARNGLDVASSFVPFFCSHHMTFRRMWGGFPHLLESGKECVEQAVDQTFNDLLPDGNLKAMHWHYVKEWWPFRHDENVLLLHYADMKRDLKAGIAKIAKFLDVDLSPEEFAKVEEKCSFPHMKANNDLFGYKLPLNDDVGPEFRTNSMVIRKGENGAGKKRFTAEQIALWTKMEEIHFEDPKMREWARNGGDY